MSTSHKKLKSIAITAAIIIGCAAVGFFSVAFINNTIDFAAWSHDDRARAFSAFFIFSSIFVWAYHIDGMMRREDEKRNKEKEAKR